MQPFAPVETADSHSRHDTPRHRGTEANWASDRAASVSSLPRCVVEPVNDAANPVVALRRFRFPVTARVRVEEGKPARVTTDRRGLYGGRVETCAGPWRTSGAWWLERGGSWDGDEWDVALSDGASYRVFRERDTDHWFISGVLD